MAGDERRGPPRNREEEPREGEELRAALERIDGHSWGRYRQLVGRYRLGEFELAIDRVPPDPFAGPARLRLSVSGEVKGNPVRIVVSVMWAPRDGRWKIVEITRWRMGE